MVSGFDGARVVNTARIGLTGGIGSGKSTVAAMFAERGVPVLDLDQVGRELTEQPEVVQRIAAEFGDDMLRDGRLDRQKLAGKVFTDGQALQRLNRLLHPLIWQLEEKWLAGLPAPFAVIEASALIESGGISRMDAVIVVLASEDERRQRVALRGVPDPSLFDAIVARQCTDVQRLAVADFVIENDGSLAALQDQVAGVYQSLCRHYPLDREWSSD